MALTQVSSRLLNTADLTLTSWTTSTRPSSPVAGQMGFNTTTGYPEWYSSDTTSWVQFNSIAPYPYTIEYLIVAGGGSGNDGYINADFIAGGGGGAGGMVTGSSTITPNSTLAATIGAGGIYAFSTEGAASGSNSSLGAFTVAIGGGGGGKQSRAGRSGGSGGGDGGNQTGTAAGTAGQGNNGGPGSSNATGGGGGGAGGAGGTPTAGAGSVWSNGSTYAVGGAGGFGGSGNGVAGTANTGNGGSGAQAGTGRSGGNGGSGVVIIRYLGSQRGTGGTVSTAGGYTYHTFTTSGTYTA